MPRIFQISEVDRNKPDESRRYSTRTEAQTSVRRVHEDSRYVQLSASQVIEEICQLKDLEPKSFNLLDIHGLSNHEAKDFRLNPEDFTTHPWEDLFRPRPELDSIYFKYHFITNHLSHEIYRHTNRSTYNVSNYQFKRLFPQFRDQPTATNKIPFIEIPTIKDAILYRSATLCDIIGLLNNYNIPTTVNNKLKREKDGHLGSCLLPTRSISGYVVIYQVIGLTPFRSLILEAKDFLVVCPDRDDLQWILLDQDSINVVTGRRGFHIDSVSVHDCVYVYRVEPTNDAKDFGERTLFKSRLPKALHLDTDPAFFFRVTHFAFVSPAAKEQLALGIIVANESPPHAVFEDNPYVVDLNQHFCDFKLANIQLDTLLQAKVRHSVSTSMRFSEPPASGSAMKKLLQLVRNRLTSRPAVGLKPISVSLLPSGELEQVKDRLSHFRHYKNNTPLALHLMTQLFNVGTSAIMAMTKMKEDSTSYQAIANIQKLKSYPLTMTLTFASTLRDSINGWRPQRSVNVLVMGTSTLCQGDIRHIHNDESNSVFHVDVCFRQQAVLSIIQAVQSIGKSINNDKGRRFRAAISLDLKDSSSAPVYNIIKSKKLTSSILSSLINSNIMQQVYGCRGMSDPLIEEIGSENFKASIPNEIERHKDGIKFSLLPEQKLAVQLGCSPNESIVAIQAACGTGKTLVGALIAGILISQQNKKIIMTAMTNSAVSNFVSACQSLPMFEKIQILRYESKTAVLAPGFPSTDVDIGKTLMNLDTITGIKLSKQEKATCAMFKKTRQVFEKANESIILTDKEISDCMKSEEEMLSLWDEMLNILFRVRPPSLICMTTAMLLNATEHGAPLEDHLDQFSILIGDEASQIPEPVFVAMTNRLPNSRQIYIGDDHQLPPYSGVSKKSYVAQLSVRGILSVLMESDAVAVANLETSFRAHPHLTELANRIAYDGRLISEANIIDRQLLLSRLVMPNPRLPFIFIDINGDSEKVPSGSFHNKRELEKCLEIVDLLVHSSIKPAQIGIIVYYREQLLRMRKALPRQYQQIDVATIDSVQGREWEVNIILTTKTTPWSNRDFLNDTNRMTVAVTRCKQGQIIFGKANALQKLSQWRTIVDYAKENNAFIDDSKIYRLRLI